MLFHYFLVESFGSRESGIRLLSISDGLVGLLHLGNELLSSSQLRLASGLNIRGVSLHSGRFCLSRRASHDSGRRLSGSENVGVVSTLYVIIARESVDHGGKDSCNEELFHFY